MLAVCGRQTPTCRLHRNLWMTLRASTSAVDKAPGDGRQIHTTVALRGSEFDLDLKQPVGMSGHIQRTADTQLSPSREAFPTRRDRGRKDCKGTRVVEMECAFRSFPGDGQR